MKIQTARRNVGASAPSNPHVVLFAAAAAYWTVHLDVPANRPEYERVDAQFNAVIRDFYTAHRLAPPEV